MAKEILCTNCGQQPGQKRYRYLCEACHKYQWRHNGKSRPKRLYLKSRRPKWCLTCGDPHKLINGYCPACYYYRRKHNGKVRPRHLWDVESICQTCGKPLQNIKSIKGYCKRCYDYQERCGKPRPRRLWGIGPLGWCDCGEPAITEINGFKICRQCTT